MQKFTKVLIYFKTLDARMHEKGSNYLYLQILPAHLTKRIFFSYSERVFYESCDTLRISR